MNRQTAEHNPRQDKRFRAGHVVTVPRFETDEPRLVDRTPRIIGVCGPARVGKDTFATAFAQQSRFRIARFSSTIKDTARLWFGWTDRHIEGEFKDVVDSDLGFSPRQFMLLCGTEFGRNMLKQDIWVRIFMRRYGVTNLVIPDVRFENEAQFVRRHHGILVHVQRAGFEPQVAVDHESEAGVQRDPARDYITPEFTDVDDVRRGAAAFYREMFEDQEK